MSSRVHVHGDRVSCARLQKMDLGQHALSATLSIQLARERVFSLLREAEEDVQKLLQSSDQVSQQSIDMRQQLEGTQQQLESQQAELVSLRQQLERRQAELDSLRQQMESQQAELARTRSQLTATQRQLKESNAKLVDVKSQLEQSQTQLVECRQQRSWSISSDRSREDDGRRAEELRQRAARGRARQQQRARTEDQPDGWMPPAELARLQAERQSNGLPRQLCTTDLRRPENGSLSTMTQMMRERSAQLMDLFFGSHLRALQLSAYQSSAPLHLAGLLIYTARFNDHSVSHLLNFIQRVAYGSANRARDHLSAGRLDECSHSLDELAGSLHESALRVIMLCASVQVMEATQLVVDPAEMSRLLELSLGEMYAGVCRQLSSDIG